MTVRAGSLRRFPNPVASWREGGEFRLSVKAGCTVLRLGLEPLVGLVGPSSLVVPRVLDGCQPVSSHGQMTDYPLKTLQNAAGVMRVP